MIIKSLSCDAITAITDAWYNQLCGSMHLSNNNFQLLQPIGVPESDEALWAYLDLVPPKTLKYNNWYYTQPGFFDQYAAIVGQLQFQESTFEKDIGADTYAKWNTYLTGLPQPPSGNALPTAWFQWAMMNAPSVANIGRTDLSYQLLIKSGLAVLAPYMGANPKLPDFSPTLADLKATLQASPPAEFSFTSTNADPDVNNSWAPGIDTSLFGIWTGSWCGFLINKKFAQSTISVSVKFDHFTVATVTPGPWYNSGLLHLALASQSVPPWRDSAGWNKYFGQDGTLNYAIGSVPAADGITISLTCDADFTTEEQAVLQSQVEMGYWPVYCRQRPYLIMNNISFNAGRTIINCQSTPGNPVLIGNNVFGIGQYLGGAQ